MALNYETRDRVAYLSFCRPEKHNALRDEDIADLESALRRFDLDDSAEVGILFGEGPSFSSGGDLKERVATPVEGGGVVLTDEADAFRDTTNWKPMIAAVHGYCLGHALGTALWCDHLIAAESARFQVTQTKFGMALPDRIARLGGGAFALDVTSTARFFGPAELDRAGYVTRVVDDGEHLSAAQALAEQILANPQAGIRSLVRYRRGEISKLC